MLTRQVWPLWINAVAILTVACRTGCGLLFTALNIALGVCGLQSQEAHRKNHQQASRPGCAIRIDTR